VSSRTAAPRRPSSRGSHGSGGARYGREVEHPYPIAMIPVSAIRLPHVRGIESRTPSSEEVETCVTAIRMNGGIGHPLTVRPAADGGYELVDGQYRFAGARQHGLAEVPCRVRDLSDEEAAVVSLLLDVRRRKPPADLARAWAIADAIELLGVRPVEFAELSRYSESEISEARSFAKAFPQEGVFQYAERAGIRLDEIGRTPRHALRAAVRAGAATQTVAEAIATLQSVVEAGDPIRRSAALSLGDGTVRVNVAALKAMSGAEKFRLFFELVRVMFGRSSSQ
jgi:ParB-like chromosome segregation protein Spo0J